MTRPHDRAKPRGLRRRHETRRCGGELRTRTEPGERLGDGSRVARNVARQWHGRSRETSEPTPAERNVEILESRRRDRGLVVITRGVTHADGEAAEQQPG